MKFEPRIVLVEDVFAGVRKALRAYDDHERTHATMVEAVVAASAANACHISDIWLREQDRLREEVGREFVQVTDNPDAYFSLIDIDWAKEMAGYSHLRDGTPEEKREEYVEWVLEHHRVTGRKVTAKMAANRFNSIHGIGE